MMGQHTPLLVGPSKICIKVKKVVKGLEILQNNAARKGLGANRHVLIEALKGDRGWSTSEERINMAKIKYRFR